MENATRKRKSCSEESEMSTEVKTRRLENPTCSVDRVSTPSCVKLVEEHENEAAVEVTSKSTSDRRESSEEVADESRLGSSVLVAAEFTRSFLANVENMRKQFIDKYNFDIVKDEPLEGPYEWVRIDQDKQP